jgi:Ca2+-binding EF-hand superfamily protein
MNPDLVAEVKEAFDLFDKKCDGVIDVEELMQVFGSFGHGITKQHLETIVQQISHDVTV